ncbi:MAG TPA: class I SAM-dependent methyltransferase, partial [Candidatus Methylomirabilis sp.]|nr:class I SAM-dependent methyltransferase [Candidatus Methylomirabilis sp.]
MTMTDHVISQIRKIYAGLEPPNTDAWSPLASDIELLHRLRLMDAMCRALRLIPYPVATLKVLDVGCGVGRSTRMLMDLGIRPENLLGVDIRPEALTYAQQLNPAVRYRTLSTLEDWPTESFELAVQCTVFGSIPMGHARSRTARLMEQSVGKGGYVFWWDGIRANDFAGGD